MKIFSPKLTMLTALGLIFCVQIAQAQSSDRYIGIDLIATAPNNSFGGFNTVGFFSNKDDVRSDYLGISITYGARDAWNWRGMAITPEVELAWYNDYNITSASFPGLPAPTFFYRSNVQTGRIGVNLWSPLATRDGQRTELGIGLGAVYRDFTTDDTVVTGSKSGFTGYGMVGARQLFEVGKRGQLSISAMLVATGKTKIALDSGGTPAGDLSLKTVAPEFRIGYQVLLGQ